MSDAWKKYVDDSRRVCKYGTKCYQKNTEHQDEFKHPPKDFRKFKNSHAAKRVKIDPHIFNKTLNTNDQSEDSRSDITESSQVQRKLLEISAVTNQDSISEKIIGNSGAKEILEIPENPSSFIEQYFLVKMPSDFFNFWEFCKSLNKSSANALMEVGLQLVGPYDVLSGVLPKLHDKSLYLLNWRYYYDPPEFQTVLAGKDKNGYHIGYFRDTPDDLPCFVANGSIDTCKITPMAENIFGAVNNYLDITKKKSPFKSILCQKLQIKLKSWASKNDYVLDTLTPSMKSRKIKVVAKTFHEAGIVVPFEKKTELGYRSLAEAEDKLKQKLDDVANASTGSEKDKAFSSIQEVITMANIATDECDFGTGLELGLDFFSFGHPALHVVAEHFLTTAYSMLNRHTFSKITTVHLANRRKGVNMSLNNL